MKISHNVRQCLRVAAMLVGGLGVACVAELWEYARLAPSTGCMTLDCFAQRKPLPAHLAKVEWSGQSKIVWIGEHKRFLAVPSGPVCYVFDERGQLIYWTSETGEGGSLDRLASQAWASLAISVDEALRLTRANSGKL